MRIWPLTNHVLIKITEAKAGNLDIKIPTAVEFGEIIATGADVKSVKKGDKVLFKSWGVDIITHEGQKYYFVSEDTNSLKAIIT